MSSNRVVFDGLDELRQQLRSLPDALAQRAAPIVTEAAERAKQDIGTAYPEKTGNLRRGLVTGLRGSSGRYGAAATLRSAAKHAWIFENGTKVRRTASGANRGQMPKGDVFIPFVMRIRRAMYAKLADLLRGEGFEVSGE